MKVLICLEVLTWCNTYDEILKFKVNKFEILVQP